jgi:hypothetical protein
MALLLAGLVLSDLYGQDLTTLQVRGVKEPVFSLNGTWKFRPDTSGNALEASLTTRCVDIQVPGEVEMQGWDLAFDKPFVYYREVAIPRDFTGKRIILRFDGVYSYARLWVNDQFMREHHGGFTRWETDIARAVKPGEKCRIRLEVTDRSDEISWGSTYAHHQIGGILRDVTLYALPKEQINGLRIETEFDGGYENALLKIAVYTDMQQPGSLVFALFDPSGNKVTIPGPEAAVSAGQTNIQWSSRVMNSSKWDPEHPNLYTLQVELRRNGSKLYSFREKVGFRKVEVRGDQLLVNGQSVKLRGTCRQEVHPLLGRASTEEYARKDVFLAKEANINYIRTSHYPPSEAFLRLCDEHGIFVECESAVCFVDRTYQPIETENNPAYTQRYLSQLEEMVVSHRNHPSIILWSIANESNYGTNLLKSYQWMKQNEPTRPVMFSWPKTVPTGIKCFDVLSSHYPNPDGTSASFEVPLKGFHYDQAPVIFDEWTHLPCYIFHTLQTDPGIREFWGQSLDKIYTAAFNSPAVGGAIWCMIDDTFMLPSSFQFSDADKSLCKENVGPCVGYGQWGLADVWRRKKPEFWSVKKAYSPVRILQTELTTFEPGRPLNLPVQNRFNHTSLETIEIRCSYQGRRFHVHTPPIPPHAEGVLTLPARDWKSGSTIDLSVYGPKGELIDEYRVRLGARRAEPLPVATTATNRVRIDEQGGQLFVRGNGFAVAFDKKTGLIRNATCAGLVTIESGPYLNLVTSDGKASQDGNLIPSSVSETNWNCAQIRGALENGIAVIKVEGSVGDIPMRYTCRVEGSGVIKFEYTADAKGAGWIHEAGLKFRVPKTLDRLSWNRKSYWSAYPPRHLGAPQGQVALFGSGVRTQYRQAPVSDWESDPVNFFLFGFAGVASDRPLTPIAKALKENVWRYRLDAAGQPAAIEVIAPEADVACRISQGADGSLVLHIDNQWDYPEIGWGNVSRQIAVAPLRGTVRFRLTPDRPPKQL